MFGHMAGYSGGAFMGLFWIAALAVAGFLIYRVGQMRNEGYPGSKKESPEEILKRRYASGELAKEEYERMLADLKR